jgi:hypothetical protein
MLVVALLLTAVSTSTSVRQSRAAVTRSEVDDPALQKPGARSICNSNLVIVQFIQRIRKAG